MRVPRLSDIVLATVYEGIDEAASAQVYTTFVANTLDRPERQRERAEHLWAQGHIRVASGPTRLRQY
ncbi:hypothetical protein [Pseudomonas sp. dw_358]|uniref:hypothetical protein n=1 Tax=Pseudomonas sp. dw_358 TaxID=2720083 RepID=UPI001BD37A62|nr:hypothetical protein [Pseudomonas sp. dw_358]